MSGRGGRVPGGAEGAEEMAADGGDRHRASHLGSSAPFPPSGPSASSPDLALVYAVASRTLTWGFRIGAALLLAGLLLALAKREPLGTEAELLPEVLPRVLNGDAAGLIDLAIIALIATPVVTTLTVALGFLRLGDRRYAALSLVVLAILGVSIGLSLLR